MLLVKVHISFLYGLYGHYFYPSLCSSLTTSMPFITLSRLHSFHTHLVTSFIPISFIPSFIIQLFQDATIDPSLYPPLSLFISQFIILLFIHPNLDSFLTSFLPQFIHFSLYSSLSSFIPPFTYRLAASCCIHHPSPFVQTSAVTQLLLIAPIFHLGMND